MRAVEHNRMKMIFPSGQCVSVPTNGASVVVGIQGCLVLLQIWVYTKLLPLASCSLLQTFLLWLVFLVSIPLPWTWTIILHLCHSYPISWSSQWPAVRTNDLSPLNLFHAPGTYTLPLDWEVSKGKPSFKVYVAIEKNNLNFLSSPYL